MQAYGGYGAPPPQTAGAIRHAYPLTVTSASFTSALVLNLRTLPYAFVRFFVHLVHAIVAIALIGGAIAAAVVVGNAVHPYAGVAVFIGGLVIYGVLWAWWFRYFLYAIKCGHVAVLTDLVTRGKVGDGTEGMIAYGRRMVKERLGDITQVYVMQAMIRGIVLEFNMGVGFLGDIMPFEIGFILRFTRRLLRASTRYLDETMFAYSLIRRNEPLWDVVSEGMGYYFQSSKEILKTSVWMMIVNTLVRAFLWIALTLAWGVAVYSIAAAYCATHGADVQSMVGPGYPGSAASDGVALAAGIVGGLILAGLTLNALEHAFLHPVYLTMVMTKFLIVVQSQPLDPSFQGFLGSPRAASLRNVAAGIDAARFARR